MLLPARKITKKMAKDSVAWFAVVNAFGVWYVLLSGQRNHARPMLIDPVRSLETLAACRVQHLETPDVDPVRDAYFVCTKPFFCDILAIIAGVLFALSPVFLFCSYLVSGPKHSYLVLPDAKPHEVPYLPCDIMHENGNSCIEDGNDGGNALTSNVE